MSEIVGLPYDDSMYIPRFWLSSHRSIGTKFKVPGEDQVYFVAMKSPLSAKVNSLFPEKYRWGVKEVMEKVREDIPKADLHKYIFVSIELSDKVQPPKSDWDELHIQNHYCPIMHNYTIESLNNFNTKIRPDLTTSYKYLYLVSCNNGHDRCGVAISMYLMQKYDMKIFDAYSLFKNSRWPGFYSQKAAAFLDKFRTKDEKKRISEAKRNDEFEIRNIDEDSSRHSKLKVQRLPKFSHFDGELMKSDVMITNFSEAINNFTPQETFIHSENNSPTPIIEYLLTSAQPESEHIPNTINPNDCIDLVKNHAYRCSFVPYGDFVYILALDPSYLIVNYGHNKYWRIPGSIDKDAVPLIFTAYAVETSTRVDFYAIDLLEWKGAPYQTVELDKRHYILYNTILPKIHVSHLADIRFKFNIRPLGRMTSLVKLSDYLLSSFCESKYHFSPRGICFLKRSPPGKTIFVPLIAHVHLFFVMNATDIAVLYARSDDNKSLVPCYFFKFEHKDHFGGLDKKVVRFDVAASNKRWEPVAICKHESPDFISFVKTMSSITIDRQATNEVLKVIENTIKDQASKKKT